MRHVILLDNKITDDEYKSWKKKDSEFWYDHLGVSPRYWVIRYDFSDYPTYVDSDGDIRPTEAYLQRLNDAVTGQYRDFGTDFIMVMIHEDNWKSDDDTRKGIWGTNYSYAFGKQCLDYCRWDRDNIANTFGTAYHERMHSFDAIIKVETGVDINPILGTKNYDREVVHGAGKDWSYIRYQENREALAVMKPYLTTAFRKRQEKHREQFQDKYSIIALLQKVIYLQRMLLNKKTGISRKV